MDDLFDLDIDALDEEFAVLTLEYQNNMRDLRTDPSNLSKKQSIIQTKEKLKQMKTWTSIVNTEEGKRLLNERRKDIGKRKYEIDQVLKTVKAQSAVDVCFLMDCTSSMKTYITSAKNDINNLMKIVSALFKTTPHLAFIGYRDFDCNEENLVKLDFTTDVNNFRKFLDNVTTLGGDDCCEDVIGKDNELFLESL
jgi:hypothetical protein